jgi:hypothetical protein
VRQRRRVRQRARDRSWAGHPGEVGTSASAGHPQTPPTLDRMDPDRLTVTRWRRFGHDRLYVSFDGAQVGWWDLLAGEPHPDTPHFLPALYTARAHWRSSGPVLAMEAPTSEISIAAVRPDRDLAAQEPAAALVARAAALERAASAHQGAQEGVVSTQPSALRRFFAWVFGTDAVTAGRTARAHQSRSWLVGAAGERRVAEVLLSLTRSDPLWQSIHSVPVGTRGSDIDHVVLGPGGIFTINTKHHPRGTVWVGGDVILVNGVARPYVRNSRHEAARASRPMACGFRVPVRGLVVTVGATLTMKTAPADVIVLDARGLSRWLGRQPLMLSVSTLGHVYAAARRESTWGPTAGLNRQSPSTQLSFL